MQPPQSNLKLPEPARYIVNGLIATAVHYAVLTINIQYIGLESAGLSNLIAAIFGIACSFFGSRYYVFTSSSSPILSQATRFISLYGFIACFHGLFLFVWTDLYVMDYRLGFLIATTFQVALSYLGNKFMVFK